MRNLFRQFAGTPKMSRRRDMDIRDGQLGRDPLNEVVSRPKLAVPRRKVFRVNILFLFDILITYWSYIVSSL